MRRGIECRVMRRGSVLLALYVCVGHLFVEFLDGFLTFFSLFVSGVFLYHITKILVFKILRGVLSKTTRFVFSPTCGCGVVMMVKV